MNKLFLVLFVLFVLTPNAWAQGKEVNIQRQNLTFDKKDNSSKTQSESDTLPYVGLWDTKRVATEVAAYEFHRRVVGFLVEDYKNLSIFVHYEGWARAPSWLHIGADWEILKYFSIGAIYQKGDGAGSIGKLYIPNTPISICVAPIIVGEGKNNPLVGFDIFVRF